MSYQKFGSLIIRSHEFVKNQILFLTLAFRTDKNMKRNVAITEIKPGLLYKLDRPRTALCTRYAKLSHMAAG